MQYSDNTEYADRRVGNRIDWSKKVNDANKRNTDSDAQYIALYWLNLHQYFRRVLPSLLRLHRHDEEIQFRFFKNISVYKLTSLHSRSPRINQKRTKYAKI